MVDMVLTVLLAVVTFAELVRAARARTWSERVVPGVFIISGLLVLAYQLSASPLAGEPYVLYAGLGLLLLRSFVLRRPVRLPRDTGSMQRPSA